MKELEKAQLGYLYDATSLGEDAKMMDRCEDLCFAYNQIPPSEKEKKADLLHQILGEMKGFTAIKSPFHCDYGKHIKTGNVFFANYNLTILDVAEVTFGDRVFIGPNCVFSTAGHAIDAAQRGAGLSVAFPIHVGNDVWIGANVSVLPGVEIGDGSIIGAGSVVNRSIPPHVIAVGNPCRVIRNVTEEDKKKYKFYPKKEV